MGPYGPGPIWPIWAQVQNGPIWARAHVAHMGPGPKWALGPFLSQNGPKNPGKKSKKKNEKKCFLSVENCGLEHNLIPKAGSVTRQRRDASAYRFLEHSPQGSIGGPLKGSLSGKIKGK